MNHKSMLQRKCKSLVQAVFPPQTTANSTEKKMHNIKIQIIQYGIFCILRPPNLGFDIGFLMFTNYLDSFNCTCSVVLKGIFRLKCKGGKHGYS